jgi:hypothetical protein
MKIDGYTLLAALLVLVAGVVMAVTSSTPDEWLRWLAS